MSHITRHRRDSDYEEYLDSIPDNPPENTTEVVLKKEFNKMNKLYEFLKDLVVFNGANNSFCSDSCPYAHPQLCHCILFKEVTPSTKRSSTCLKVFGDTNET